MHQCTVQTHNEHCSPEVTAQHQTLGNTEIAHTAVALVGTPSPHTKWSPCTALKTRQKYEVITFAKQSLVPWEKSVKHSPY